MLGGHRAYSPVGYRLFPVGVPGATTAGVGFLSSRSVPLGHCPIFGYLGCIIAVIVVVAGYLSWDQYAWI